MSDLIEFQQQRISALETEVKTLNDQLISARRELMAVSLQTDQAALKITVTDPKFFKPISDMEFEIK